MIIYAVFREGVYRHQCAGVFDSLAAATACADSCAETDVDDHHTYVVVPFGLNEMTPRGPTDDSSLHCSPEIIEAKVEYTCSKGETL